MAKILIVEDNFALLKALEVKLLKEGYEVLTAKDGEEALLRFREGPDAVLLDILLPKKDGFQVLEELQPYPDLLAIPIIVISNSGQPVEIDKARRLGARDFLIKTDFTPQEVVEKLAKYVAPSSAKSALTPAPATGAASRGFILVVEDDSFLRSLLVDKLKKSQFQVEEAPGGREALEILSRTSPQLVMLDLVMPGIDGFQVLQEIRQNSKIASLPVIVLSNLGEQEHIMRAKKLGIEDYMVKANFTLNEIVDRIGTALKKNQK